MMEIFHSILLLLLVVGQVGSQVTVDEDLDETGGPRPKDEEMFEFKSPDMTDEEQWSNHMPIHMECDGCKLIATLLHLEFEKATMRKKSRKFLLESEAIEVVESVCENKYEDYGAKDVNGVLRLSGPHTVVQDMPGVMSGGGKWPNRIRELCSRYWDELGDEGLYAAWLDDGSALSRYMCYAPEKPRNACYVMRMSKLNQKHVPDDAREHFVKTMAELEDERKERLEKVGEETRQLRHDEELKAHEEL